MGNKTITVILTAHNEEEHASEALESIIAQSWLKTSGHQVEFYIVDDGSTDRTYEVLNKFEGHHQDESKVYGIHILPNYQKKGIINSQRLAVKELVAQKRRDNRQRNVAFFDLDDRMHEDFMSICSTALESDENIKFAYPHGTLIDERGKPYINGHGVRLGEFLTIDFDPIKYLKELSNYIPNHSLIKEELVYKAFKLMEYFHINNFPNSIAKLYRYACMMIVMAKEMKESQSKQKGLYVQKCLFDYRVGNNSSAIKEALEGITDEQQLPSFVDFTDKVPKKQIEFYPVLYQRIQSAIATFSSIK